MRTDDPARAATLLTHVLHLRRGDVPDGGDLSTDLRAVFAASVRAVSPPAARLFRLVGVHPGPDVTVSAAASLTSSRPVAARGWLRELADAHLLRLLRCQGEGR